MEIKRDFYLNKLISFPEGFDGEVKEVYEITEEGRKAYENFTIWENSVEVDVRGGYPVMVRIYSREQ